MELNGVQIDKNKAAFEWGRRCAHDLAAVQALTQTAQVIQLLKRPALDELIGSRVEFLTAYQNAGYAAQYRAFVDQVRAAEAAVAPAGSTRLTEAVARYLFKLMAYKDEYEVARLHTDPAFTAQIAATFDGPVKLRHHLAPPLFARRGDDGQPRKTAFGAWVRPVMGVLAKFKGLRGRWLDPFGHTEERRTERALIAEYRASIETLLKDLSAERLPLALEIARLPEEIRGYGHVKARHLAAVRPKWQALMLRWQQPVTPERQPAAATPVSA